MDWRALEEHFRVAGTQDAGPFGDDAIEWDYSRYARGLGLTGEPGAHDLPHRGCAVAALPVTRWDAAERKLRGWAEERGWGLWRFSARPTVAVPDPVTYALGVRAAGPDSLLFARAALPVRPAMGRRARSEGMSFPLTPGERWLIATDRVRRRTRAEIGMRGLVLFVEEAEWLTPAGLALLMYLLDAHRAWRARMLSRAARVYVVLATAPEHEASVVRMLERFHLNGHPPILRERRKAESGAAGFAPPALRDVEEEDLFGALAAAPAALAEEDVRAVFGASAVGRCRAMVERGLLRERTEAGQLCYVPNPAVSATAPAPRRALLAVEALYRRRARRGHEHLALAAAALSVALGKPLHAQAAVARMPHTGGALLPLRLFEALDAALEPARPRLRADHVSAWFSLVAHHRDYDRARELANAVAERELRTWKEMHRVVQVVLCTGRTHLDTCLPPDFWPKLKSRRLTGPFMDATCVLAELFWRKRYLSNSDIRQRFEFACECFARAEAARPQSKWFDRIDRIGRLAIYRAALHLDLPSAILLPRGGGADAAPKTLRAFLRTYQMPAYVAAAPAFAEAATGCMCMPRSLGYEDRFFAVQLGATTGQLADLAVTTATTLSYLGVRGLWLLVRDTVDDLLVSLPHRAHPDDRHDLGRFLLYTAGGRWQLIGAHAIHLKHGRHDVPGRDAFDEVSVAEVLMLAGDLAGARDRLMVGFKRAPRYPLLLALLIETHIILARKSLDLQLLASTTAILDHHASVLSPDLQRYLSAFLKASEALCVGSFDLASQLFLRAHAEIRNTTEWARTLKNDAMASSVRARHAGRVSRALLSEGTGSAELWRTIRVLCSGRDWRMASPSLRARASVCLDYLCGVIDAWAQGQRDGEEVLRVALFLKGATDAAFRPLGRDFLGLMAQWAPHFYEKMRLAVVERMGDVDLGPPEVRAVSASLRTIEEAWKNGHGQDVDDRCGRVRIYGDRSRARQARTAGRVWYDDATTYAQLWDGAERIGARQGGEHAVMAYGYVGRSGMEPVATVLAVRMTMSDSDVWEVDVDARAALRRAGPMARRSCGPGCGSGTFIGQSDAAKKVRALIDCAARCAYPTLISGETGVGKELVAKAIHSRSTRRGKPMVVAECSSMAESLLESELFGHDKGAFTGAYTRHEGVFERAHGSSLLLDEVDSMSSRMQAALLRVLETGEYRRVGAATSGKSDFRLISAALPRLLAMVEAGEFRQDLFYRISTLRIEIPPLRQREGDSQEIATSHARALGLRLTSGALRAITSYEWPGNVRQLRHCIQAASLHAADGRIGESAMADVIASYRGSSGKGDQANREGVDTAWERALRTLERMKRFGAWDFAKAADLSRRSAQRHIAQLLREGRIVRMGAGRATRYGLRS